MAKKIDVEDVKELNNGITSELGKLGMRLNELLKDGLAKGSGFRACNSAHGHITGLKAALIRIEKSCIAFNKHQDKPLTKQTVSIARAVKNGDITKEEALKAISVLFDEDATINSK